MINEKLAPRGYGIDWKRAKIPYDGTGGDPADLKLLRESPSQYILLRNGKSYLCAGVPGHIRGGSYIPLKKKKENYCRGETFQQYYFRKYKLRIQHDEPLVEVYPLFKPKRSALRPYVSAEGYVNQFVPVQQLRVYHTDFRRVGRLVSILYRLDNLMVAHNLAMQIGLPRTSNLDLIRQALTHKAADEQENYERLELLGDALLKFNISLRLLDTKLESLSSSSSSSSSLSSPSPSACIFSSYSHHHDQILSSFSCSVSPLSSSSSSSSSSSFLLTIVAFTCGLSLLDLSFSRYYITTTSTTTIISCTTTTMTNS